MDRGFQVAKGDTQENSFGVQEQFNDYDFKLFVIATGISLVVIRLVGEKSGLLRGRARMYYTNTSSIIMLILPTLKVMPGMSRMVNHVLATIGLTMYVLYKIFVERSVIDCVSSLYAVGGKR